MSVESGLPAAQTTAADAENAPTVQDAIDLVFAEYNLLFGAQFRKSFPAPEHIQAAKKTWYGFFRLCDAQVFMQAARNAARKTRYLPTVYEVTEQCMSLLELPETAQAWQEACDAMPPWELWQWSHPAVYYAARLCGNILQEEKRDIAFPVFRRHYQGQCRRVLEGARLRMPRILPEPKESSLSRSQAEQRLADIRKKLRL